MPKTIVYWIIGMLGLFTAGMATGQSTPAEYINALIKPPSFPESVALKWEIQKEKMGNIDLDDAELNKHILIDYSQSEKLRAQYPNRDDFIAMVKSNILASTNRIFRSIETVSLSKQGRHLQTSLLDNQPADTEVVQILNGENTWKTLWIDHKKKSALIQNGERGIFSDCQETGLFNGDDRLLLIALFRSLPDMDISAAINSFCASNYLAINNRSIFFESHSEETPPYFLLTYKNTGASFTTEYKLNPVIPGVLMSKRSTTPQFSMEWSFDRPNGDKNITVFPQSTHMKKKDPAGNLVEQEWRSLQWIHPANEWDINQIWANKLGEISGYALTQ